MEKRTDTDEFRVSQTGCTLLSLIRGPIAEHAVPVNIVDHLATIDGPDRMAQIESISS
jgi:hypothetical protein